VNLVIVWSDDSTSVIPVTVDMVTGFDSSAATPSQTLTVTYGNYSATYDIAIVEPITITEIEISEDSTYKTRYVVGDELSLEGMNINVTWSDDSTTVIPVTEEMVSGF